MFKKITVAAVATTFSLSASMSYAGPKAEVLHWWTSEEKLNQWLFFKRIL